MSMRLYLFIALIVGGLVYLTSMFFGDDIIVWANREMVRADIAGVSAVGTIVMEPIRFVMQQGTLGAIIAGLLWPAVPVWLILILVHLVMVAGVQYAGEVREMSHIVPTINLT